MEESQRKDRPENDEGSNNKGHQGRQDELESRFQRKDGDTRADENDREDERYMRRSSSRHDDRPGGHWGYKQWGSETHNDPAPPQSGAHEDLNRKEDTAPEEE